MNGSASAEGREKWRRSKFPRKVELCNPPEEHEKLVKYVQRLWREDYGPPSVCILIPGEDERDFDKRQMVPPQFIAGRFHMWVNLGPKLAWETMAGGLSFCAFVLGSLEVLAYGLTKHDSTLQACSDVLNRQCTLLNEDDKNLGFRPSTGALAALLGASFALLACLCFRVAVKLDGEHDNARSCKEYFRAPFYIFRMTLDFASFVLGSICRCLRSCCKKHCAPAEKAEDQEVPLLEGERA